MTHIKCIHVFIQYAFINNPKINLNLNCFKRVISKQVHGAYGSAV